MAIAEEFVQLFKLHEIDLKLFEQQDTQFTFVDQNSDKEVYVNSRKEEVISFKDAQAVVPVW